MSTEQEIRNKVKIFRPTSQEVSLFDPNLNDKSTRLFKFKDDKHNRYKIWVFTNRVTIEIPTENTLNFSINIPDKVCLANIFLKEIQGIGIIFIKDRNDELILSCINLLSEELQLIQLDKDEGLIVYRNGIQLILNPKRELLKEIESFGKIKSKIELNYPSKNNKAVYSDLPKDLRKILLKFERFAVSDDFERDELIEGLSTKERNDLIKEVEPKFEEINLFLDTFGDKKLTEGAIGLQCLAELTIELTNDENKNRC